MTSVSFKLDFVSSFSWGGMLTGYIFIDGGAFFGTLVHLNAMACHFAVHLNAQDVDLNERPCTFMGPKMPGHDHFY